MKRILLSLGIIVAVSGIVAGATGAFFSDTETSSGNILTAGSIDLTVDSQGSSYNGNNLLGTNFPSKNLDQEHFFVFEDIKPGDYGVRNISLHAESNSAYACLLIGNKDDQERDLVDPEADAGDTITSDGELSKELQLFVWEDRDGDQKYEPLSPNFEPPLMHDGANSNPDSFFDITYEIFFDSTSGIGPLIQNNVRHIVLAWCAGNQSVVHNNTPGNITCDGLGMGDGAQTDSFSADVVLYAEQVRNNPNFRCQNVKLE
jgi:predicted ribosomally synthesized peptide with SipW-like signal peptide